MESRLPSRSHPSPPERARQEGTNWKRWVAGTALVLLLILIAQNSQKVEVNFFFASTETPLVFALAIAGLLGVLIGFLAPRVRRHERSRHERSEK